MSTHEKMMKFRVLFVLVLALLWSPFFAVPLHKNSSTPLMNPVYRSSDPFPRTPLFSISPTKPVQGLSAQPSMEVTAEPTIMPIPTLPPEALDKPESLLDPINVPSTKNHGQKACFPLNAMVMLSSGHEIAIQHIQVGNRVQISPGLYSPVLFSTHASNTTNSEMVVLLSKNGGIAASRSHYIFTNRGLMAAGDINIGDKIFVMRRGALGEEPVISATIVRMTGLYNPQTASGAILVRHGSGGAVLASTYTTAIAPAAARALEMPLRCIHNILSLVIPELLKTLKKLITVCRLRKHPEIELPQSQMHGQAFNFFLDRRLSRSALMK